MKMADAKQKRNEQLKRWIGSETDLEPPVVKRKKTKVKFDDGAVFLAACSSGDTEEVLRLLERGADINYANVDGLTALHQVGAAGRAGLGVRPEGRPSGRRPQGKGPAAAAALPSAGGCRGGEGPRGGRRRGAGSGPGAAGEWPCGGASGPEPPGRLGRARGRAPPRGGDLRELPPPVPGCGPRPSPPGAPGAGPQVRGGAPRGRFPRLPLPAAVSGFLRPSGGSAALGLMKARSSVCGESRAVRRAPVSKGKVAICA